MNIRSNVLFQTTTRNNLFSKHVVFIVNVVVCFFQTKTLSVLLILVSTFRVLRKPSFLNPAFLFKQFEYAPQT